MAVYFIEPETISVNQYPDGAIDRIYEKYEGKEVTQDSVLDILAIANAPVTFHLIGERVLLSHPYDA